MASSVIAVTNQLAPRRTSTAPAVDTRARILDAARRAFAEFGYGATSNRIIAQAAGVTTGSIYYHFESKVDLYREVYGAAQTHVYDRFDEAIAGSSGLVQTLEAVFSTANEMNIEDPSLASFLSGVRIDVGRYPELQGELGQSDPRRIDFFEKIIDRAIAAGELAPSTRRPVTQLVRAFAIGLTDGYSHDADLQREAIDGLMIVIEGLVRSVDDHTIAR
ncbi:MAG: TetR/AcrR family transcriptional regulator [Acidimicrobiales bacterium]